MSHVITEMAATGHVYVRLATPKDEPRMYDMSRNSNSPGTREAVGCWTFSQQIPTSHDTTCCGCNGVFFCYNCEKYFGWCMGGDDDEPNWCNGCWEEKHAAGLGIGSNKAFRRAT